MNTYQLTSFEEEARKRVCIALDDPDEYRLVAQDVRDLVGVFKVGKILHTVSEVNKWGVVQELHGYSPDYPNPNIFLDLKLHDTPETVREAARRGVNRGVYMFDVHIAGGEAMCKAAIQGAREAIDDATREARRYNHLGVQPIPLPKVIGVTELTSIDDNDLRIQGITSPYAELVLRRAELAREWGLDGIVCPANQAGELEKKFGSDWLYVTPGVQWAGIAGAGQKQLYTPDQAVRDCTSSILVIGSAITKAENRRQTAYNILQAMGLV